MFARSSAPPDVNGLGLEALMSVALSSHPDRLFLREPARRASWAGTDGQNLSFGAIDLRAHRLATILALSKVPARSQSFILAPEGSEQLIALLGSMRAGLQPFLLPMSISPDALQACLDAGGPSVAIGTTRCGDFAPAMLLRNAAARAFNVRLVCAFGADPPDGVAPLDMVLASDMRSDLAPPNGAVQPPPVIAAETAHGVRQIMTEADIIAAAVDFARQARLVEDHRVLSLMMSPSLCALATGPYVAMLTGAEYLPLGLFSLSALWAGISDGKPTTLVAPALIEGALRASGVIGHASLANLVLIHTGRFATASHAGDEPTRIFDASSDSNNAVTFARRI